MKYPIIDDYGKFLGYIEIEEKIESKSKFILDFFNNLNEEKFKKWKKNNE